MALRCHESLKEAMREYSARFDKAELESFEVSTADATLAAATAKQVVHQLSTLATETIAAESWRNYGEITVCADEA